MVYNVVNRMKKISSSKKLIVNVGKNLSSRSFKNFHNGKSLPKTIYSASRYLVNHGPKTTYLVTKQVLRADGRVVFPNGLVLGKNLDVIRSWYSAHGKKTIIIIPSYNDTLLIKQCLASIKKTVPSAKYHVVVVDDYCTNESRESLSAFESKNVTVIYRDKNGGFAVAVNTGMNYSLKKFPHNDIVLLNSDTVAHKDWLAALQHGAYQYAKNVGIVGAKLLYQDGRIQSAGSFRNTELPEWFDHYYRFQPSDYAPANIPQYCIGVTGACMYITNKTLKKLGILDDKFPFAFEDMDYCIRAWNKDMKVLYYPAAELTHLESATRGLNKNIGEKEKASVRYFWKKWGDWFDKRNILTKDGKIKIIYVLQSTGVSGGHRIVFEHLNNLKKLGYDAELWALDKAPTWTELNVPTVTFRNYPTLVKSLKEVEAIKVATWWETAAPVWEASISKGIPAFIIHEIESAFYPNNPAVQAAVISCYRKEFNNIISCGYTLDGVKSLGLSGKLIPCGYDSDNYKPIGIKKSDDELLAVGRTFFQKNFKQTLAAWKSLPNRPNFVLFGSEPQIVKKDKAITYHVRPSNKEVNVLYNSATAFIQTSYHEGFCLPVLEAMAAGCPVICTDANGNMDFSFDGKNCLMVEKDDVQGTAKAISKLMKDTALRDKLRKAGLKTAQKYTWPVVMSQIDSFYNEIASSKKREYIKKAMSKYL